MRALLRIILPPAIVFAVFLGLIKYNPFHFPVADFAGIGSGTPYGLIAYFKTFMPFLFVVALLTQVLITIPLWRMIIAKPAAAPGIILGTILVCAILSVGLSYIIWDRATGLGRFIHISWFMAAVQTVYWLINFAILRLVDWNRFNTAPTGKQEEQVP